MELSEHEIVILISNGVFFSIPISASPSIAHKNACFFFGGGEGGGHGTVRTRTRNSSLCSFILGIRDCQNVNAERRSPLLFFGGIRDCQHTTRNVALFDGYSRARFEDAHVKSTPRYKDDICS